MPRRSQQQTTGSRGEAFTALVVSSMGFIWNPVHEDNAVDGTIEIVDRDGVVTGNRILVQVKATANGFKGGSDGQFVYGFKEDHIDYWLRCGLPVIAVCVDLAQGRAWWKNLSSWFADPANKRRRNVVFDRSIDEFTGGAATRLVAAATPEHQALPRLRGAETLVSNLLAITGFAPLIYGAPTECRDRSHAWDLMRAADDGFESGFILDGGNVYSFVSVADGPLAALTNGAGEAIPTSEWAHSDDADLRRRFVRLANFTLRAMHHRRLAFHPKKTVVYYKRTDDRRAAKIKGRGTRDRGRTFFSPVQVKDDLNRVSHYRHVAARLSFRRFDCNWYLEIDPTWHFTTDGEKDSPWDAEKVSALKRLEGNHAVKDHVRAWADYLRRPTEDTLFDAGDHRVSFGELLTVQADAAIDERVWKASASNEPGPLLGLIQEGA